MVDDNEDVLSLVQTRLRKAGHLVNGASSGSDAISLVDEKGSPDVAVLDVDMPGMTGLELCVELRDRVGNQDLPVIFLSAKVQAEDIRRGYELGATYLTKPFVASALIDAVERSLPRESGTW